MTDEKREGIESARVTIVSLLRLPVDTPWLDVLTEVTRLRDLAPTPKPAPTLDLPPAPEGMRWARTSMGRVVHLAPVGSGRRACAPATDMHRPRTIICASSRACPACIAIARGEK